MVYGTNGTNGPHVLRSWGAAVPGPHLMIEEQYGGTVGVTAAVNMQQLQQQQQHLPPHHPVTPTLRPRGGNVQASPPLHQTTPPLRPRTHHPPQSSPRNSWSMMGDAYIHYQNQHLQPPTGPQTMRRDGLGGSPSPTMSHRDGVQGGGFVPPTPPLMPGGPSTTPGVMPMGSQIASSFRRLF